MDSAAAAVEMVDLVVEEEVEVVDLEVVEVEVVGWAVVDSEVVEGDLAEVGWEVAEVAAVAG